MKNLNSVLLILLLLLLLSSFQLFSQNEITDEELYDYEVLVNHLVKYQGNLNSLSEGDSATLLNAKSFFNSTSTTVYNELVENNTSVEVYYENILTGGKRNYNYNKYYFQKNIREKSVKIFIPRTITVFDSTNKIEKEIKDKIEIEIDEEFNRNKLKISSIKKVEEIPDLSEYISYSKDVDGVLDKRNRKNIVFKNGRFSDEEFNKGVTKIMDEYIEDYLLIQNSKDEKANQKKKSYLGNFTKDAKIRNDLDDTSNGLITHDLYAFKISESKKISEFVGEPKIKLISEESKDKKGKKIELEGEIILLKKINGTLIQRKCRFGIKKYKTKKNKFKSKVFKISSIESLPYLKSANHYLSANDKEMARNGVQDFFNKFMVDYEKLQATPSLKDEVLSNYFSSSKSSAKYFDPNTNSIKESSASTFLNLISNASFDKKKYSIHLLDDWSKVIVHEGENGKNAPYIVARVRDTIKSDKSICVTERNFTIRFLLKNGKLSKFKISSIIFKDAEEYFCSKSPSPPPPPPPPKNSDYSKAKHAFNTQGLEKFSLLFTAIKQKSNGKRVNVKKIKKLFLNKGSGYRIEVSNHSRPGHESFEVSSYFTKHLKELSKTYKSIEFDFKITNEEIKPGDMGDSWIGSIYFTQIFKGKGPRLYCDQTEKIVDLIIFKEDSEYTVYFKDIWWMKTLKIDCN